jgi:nitrite reductase/ring-hydroxylating ferredoxin subunit/thioredoxin reductase
MGGDIQATGPDFAAGIAIDAVPAEGTLAGRVGEQPVLLSRLDGEWFAVSGGCTHYGAPLAEGLLDGTAVHCPWHHACFDLKTGAALRAPALDPLDRWRVEVEGGTVFVRDRLEAPATPPMRSEVERVVIVGGGAAGVGCANELRRLGYSGAITMLSADGDPPVDRPNLSKDYLAGVAPEEWMPLRPEEWYADNKIDLRLSTEVTEIDIAGRRVVTSGGEYPFDRLLLATGSEPNRLDTPGFNHPNVLTLRSFADARAIVAKARAGAKAVIIGSSFIGMEAAAALRKREVEVHVIARDAVPFARVFGEEIGRFLRARHEQEDVHFHADSAAASFDGTAVSLDNGERIDADLVLVGIGVKPRTELAAAAGIAVDKGVLVDTFLATSAPGIFAARYYQSGAHRATAGVGRDLEMLGDERQLEASIHQAGEPRAAAAVQSTT